MHEGRTPENPEAAVKPQTWMFLLFALSTGTSCAAAAPAAFYGRIGGLGQGPQGGLQSGLEFGGGVDFDLSNAFALGGGVAHALDTRTGVDASCTSVEVHSRFRLGYGDVHPFVDMGVGLYSLHSDVPAVAQGLVDQRHNAPGVLAGLGLEVRSDGPWGVRAGATYHTFASEIAIEGGDMADYFALGVSLEYRLKK